MMLSHPGTLVTNKKNTFESVTPGSQPRFPFATRLRHLCPVFAPVNAVNPCAGAMVFLEITSWLFSSHPSTLLTNKKSLFESFTPGSRPRFPFATRLRRGYTLLSLIFTQKIDPGYRISMRTGGCGTPPPVREGLYTPPCLHPPLK